MNTITTWLRFQIIFLLAGVIWSWANTIQSFIKFYGYEGTIIKFSNCIIPNPLTEPCFYGAVGFVVALVWTIIVYRKIAQGKINRLVHSLWLFISAGTIFAYYNVTREFTAFYTSPATALGCSAVPITNPFLTPCFTGAALYLLSAITSGVVYSKLPKQG